MPVQRPSPKPFYDHWWPESRAGLWLLGFAALFFVAFQFQIWIGEWLDVVSNRVSLVFLPAFVRVAAVLVAGLAGALGIALGSFLVCVLLLDDPLGLALLLSFASGAGVWGAYWLMCKSLKSDNLPFTLGTLVTLAIIYSAINAILHGVIWDLPQYTDMTANELTVMMLGDLLGVAVGFFILRFFMRFFRVNPAAS